MIRIRYSNAPSQELDLEGSNQELRDLRSVVLGLDIEIVVDAGTDYDPSPYELALSRLRITVSDSLINISVTDSELRITGRKYLLDAFADSLPWDAKNDCHGHFDGLGTTEVFAEESLGIVLTLKR